MEKANTAQLLLMAVIGVAIIGAAIYMNQLNSKMADPKFLDKTLVAYATKKDTKEARAWLQSGGDATHKILDSTGKGLTYSRWGALVNQLYASGARKVYFVGIMNDGGVEYTHGMFLEMPDDPFQRKQLFSGAPLTWPVRTAPPQDAGQRYVLVWFD